MFRMPAVSATTFLLAGTILLLASPRTCLSQISSDEAIDAIDEIVVYGEPTLRLLRDEVWLAEDNFYELFNSLNKGRQFDVTCFHRRPLGSQIARRVCEANFVKNGQYGVPHWAFVRHKTKQMQQEMVALVDKHPELQEALVAYVDAKKTFDFSFRDRCDERFAICQK